MTLDCERMFWFRAAPRVLHSHEDCTPTTLLPGLQHLTRPPTYLLTFAIAGNIVGTTQPPHPTANSLAPDEDKA